LVKNEESDKEELFARAAAQVNRVALHFRGTAALWWQNLRNKPVTWKDLPDIRGQRSTEDKPRWYDIDREPGLKTLLLKRFQSQTHIGDERRRLAAMTFDPKGKEDIETFAAKMDANLNIIGMPYDDDNDIVNGNRAEQLFRALPAWLEQKIREQGNHYRCPHEQWCFGRVLEKAKTILSARREDAFPKKDKEHKKEYKSDNKPVYREKRTENKNYQRKPFDGPKFKKLTEMSEEEREKMKKDNICFFCREKGHSIADCKKKTTQKISSITEEGEDGHLSVVLEEITDDNHPIYKKLHPEATIPTKGTNDSAGYDLYNIGEIYLEPGDQQRVPIGLALRGPRDTYGQIMSRSNLAAKGLVVEAGTIDRDYTGEISVLLHNQGKEIWYIPSKRKIAQILFLVVKNIEECKEVEELPQTNRGDKGFGSTDKVEQKLEPKKSKEEKWYKNLEEGYAPHGRCPHGVGMYSSSMVDECWACRVELQKRKVKKDPPIEEKQEEPPRIEEVHEIIEDTENPQEQHQEVNSASNCKKSFIFEGDIDGESVKVLIDSGSTGNFLDKKMTQ
jgi:deoxyuridine 5'-triphosphate nucleotidohydrolase